MFATRVRMQLQICIAKHQPLWTLTSLNPFLIQCLHAPISLNFYCPFHNTLILIDNKTCLGFECLWYLHVWQPLIVVVAAVKHSVGWWQIVLYHACKCTPWVLSLCTKLQCFTCVQPQQTDCSSSSNVTFSFVGWRWCQRRWCVVERKKLRPSSITWSSQGELCTKVLSLLVLL